MQITYDPNKRAETLKYRNLDFEDAAKVFAGKHFQMEDDRQDYGEERFAIIGLAGGQILYVAYTERKDVFRIISARAATEHEQEIYFQQS